MTKQPDQPAAQQHIAADRQASLVARYGAAIPPAGPWNDQLSLLLSHRSVRAYAPDPLPAGTLETLVAAGQSAATSSNLQAWSVVAVTDPVKKAKLAEYAGGQKHIEQCPLFLIWIADLARNQRVGAEADVEMESAAYLETFLVAAIDAALAAQNAVIAAESLDLSTVYIGAMRNQPEAVAEMLGLPPATMAVFGLCVGYAAAGAEGQVKPRLPQSAVLFEEHYGVADETQLRAAYDVEMGNFSRRQNMPVDSWSARVLERMGPIKSMKGRDRLKEIIRRLGFPLR
jgi:nitroreductase